MTCEGMSTGRLLPAAGPLTENARRLIYSNIKKTIYKATVSGAKSEAAVVRAGSWNGVLVATSLETGVFHGRTILLMCVCI